MATLPAVDGPASLTRAHLAVAALCAPAVLPPAAAVPYLGHGHALRLSTLPDAFRARVAAWRATPTGQLVLQCYATARLTCLPVPRDAAEFVDL